MASLAVMRAGGRLLAHGTATLTVTGPRPTWAHRAATGAVCVVVGTLTALVMVLPGVAAACAPLPIPAWAVGLVALAPAVALVAETVNILWHGRRAVTAAVALRALRADGTIWWEAATLVAHEEEPLSAGRLVSQALALADARRVGLVAVPATAQIRRAYQRRGFVPWPPDSRILHRPPACRTTQ